ncbi:hypothetical protein ACN4EK_01155 [Pantanalinema rosaneae CENA516]|uniref:hypothetical protein n=1 Tax=Pantanalinema rosaneae TaxID=1620701 RepID=UPI003D6FBEA3
MVKLTFETSMGDEYVYIRPCGKNADGNTILEFASLGMPIPDNETEFAAMAIALMERNGEIPFGHWGIEKIQDKRYFTVFASLIANTMDNDEFRGGATAIVNERVRMLKSIQKNSIDF